MLVSNIRAWLSPINNRDFGRRRERRCIGRGAPKQSGSAGMSLLAFRQSSRRSFEANPLGAAAAVTTLLPVSRIAGINTMPETKLMADLSR